MWSIWLWPVVVAVGRVVAVVAVALVGYSPMLAALFCL
jgi:hypothetical protein